jgi:hypothetical protein
MKFKNPLNECDGFGTNSFSTILISSRFVVGSTPTSRIGLTSVLRTSVILWRTALATAWWLLIVALLSLWLIVSALRWSLLLLLCGGLARIIPWPLGLTRRTSTPPPTSATAAIQSPIRKSLRPRRVPLLTRGRSARRRLVWLIRSKTPLAIDLIAAVPTLIDPIIRPAIICAAIICPAIICAAIICAAVSWRRCGLLTDRFGNRLDNRLNVFRHR